jgi:hypothetical protein
VSTGFAGRAGRLRSKLSLHFLPTVNEVNRQKVQDRENDGVIFSKSVDYVDTLRRLREPPFLSANNAKKIT